MWYIFILIIFFRILALENIAKIDDYTQAREGWSGPPVLTPVDQRMNKWPMNIFYEHFYLMQVILPIIHHGL